MVKKTSRTNTPSLKRALQGDFGEKEKEISAIDQHKMFTQTDKTENFTQEELAKKWKEYLPRLDDRPNLKSTLAAAPVLQDNFVLLLEIDNRIQDDLITTIKPELITWLRKELNNSKISLKTKISDSVREKIVYSDIERYEAMARKNPNLALLKRTLNLDF